MDIHQPSNHPTIHPSKIIKIILSKGFADKKIPINDSSTYFIMYLPDPRKYDGVKRLVDVRLTATNCKDHIYDFSFDQSKATKVGPSVWFEPKKSGLVHLLHYYLMLYQMGCQLPFPPIVSL